MLADATPSLTFIQGMAQIDESPCLWNTGWQFIARLRFKLRLDSYETSVCYKWDYALNKGHSLTVRVSGAMLHIILEAIARWNDLWSPNILLRVGIWGSPRGEALEFLSNVRSWGHQLLITPRSGGLLVNHKNADRSRQSWQDPATLRVNFPLDWQYQGGIVLSRCTCLYLPDQVQPGHFQNKG